MKWIDRIRLVKIILVITAVVIAVVSLVVFHFLINDLSKEERSRMSVWAEAMHSLNAADETTDLNLVLKVINENNTIPVIVLDAEGKLQVFRNVDIKADNYADSLKVVSSLARQWLQSGRMIKLSADKHNNSDLGLFYCLCLLLYLFYLFPKEQNRIRFGLGCLRKRLISLVHLFRHLWRG